MVAEKEYCASRFTRSAEGFLTLKIFALVAREREVMASPS